MSLPIIVDSHCHLDFHKFDSDRDDVVRRARTAGVARMVTICVKLGALAPVLAVARAYPDIYASVGVHPHHVGEEEVATVDRLCDLANDPKIVAIGETGLDFHYDYGPRDRQALSFRRHIAAARRSGLPLVVHTRSADDKTIEILAEGRDAGPFSGVIHCFSTGRELAEKAVEMGFYISLSGILTFKSAEDIRATVRDLPLTRLLVETDAPYLAPVPHRGKRCEPAHVADTLRFLAELKGVSVEACASATTANFFHLFSKVPRPT
ncbi:MAG: TatD family hydrolase [Pseudomonadota bacterium]|nr:TatD family hydrolase [Pseudomonadota bacterium]